MGQRAKIQLLIAEVERGAYQRGVEDTVRVIQQALAKLAPPASGKQPETKGKSKEGFVVRPNSNSAFVLEVIRVHPGLRGVDLHRLVATSGRPINERTMRTALLRLNRRGVIEQREGRWYVKDELPGLTEELTKELKFGGGIA